MKNSIRNIRQHRKILIVLIAVELALLFLLLPGLWEKGEARQFSPGEIVETAGIAVAPLEAGVYRISVEYLAAEGTNSIVSVVNDNNIYKGTYSNPMVLPGEDNFRTTTVWLTKATEALSIQVAPGENAWLTIENLEIARTNQGAVIAIVGLLLFGVPADAVCVCLYHIRGKEDEKARRWTGVAVAAIATLVSLPLLVDYCLSGTELHLHLRRIEDMKDGLLSGQFHNITLLFPALLRLAGFPVQTAYRLTLLLMNFGATGIAYGCFKGIFQDRRMGLIGSMLYVCAPYRLDALYAKADYGESVALCFLPLVFYGFYRLLTVSSEEESYRYVWVWPSIALSCMFQAHITAFLTAGFMAVLLCAFYWKRVCTRSGILALCKTAAAVLALNAWLAVPLFDYLFLEKKWVYYVGGPAIQQAGMFWSHFLTAFFVNGDSRSYGESGMTGAAPLGIGFVLTGLMLLYLWVCFVGRYRRQRKEEPLWKFSTKAGIVGAVLMFMSTRYFPWDALRGGSRIVQILTAELESPAELLPVVTICFTLLGCTVIWQILKAESRTVTVCLLAAVLGTAVITTQFLTGDFLRDRGVERIYAGESLQDTQVSDSGCLFPETGYKRTAE